MTSPAKRAEWRRLDQQRRRRLLERLDAKCCHCELDDVRGLLVIQPPGHRLSPNELYTLALNEPDLALRTLRFICGTCRQIELVVFGKVRHHAPSVAPSMSSPDVHPSASDDQPSVSSGGGADRDGWALSAVVAGVAFG